MQTSTNFLDQINILSSQTIQLCYHCHKCTSGCPVVSEMAYGPDRVLRMVQMGQRQQLLESADIWLCAGCETCGTRCPNGIDIARVMDSLRTLAISSDMRIAELKSAKFHRLFLEVIHRLGRTHEATLLAGYKLWALDLLSDMDSGARLFVKGKVPLLPSRFHAHREIQHLFDAAVEMERVTPGKETGKF
jgi:heterodisulfide reductase subunit C